MLKRKKGNERNEEREEEEDQSSLTKGIRFREHRSGE
jgi:hypothetical protein